MQALSPRRAARRRRKRGADPIFALAAAGSAAVPPAGDSPAPARTLGIDLSASAARTAAVALDWEGDRLAIGAPAAGLDDAALLDLFAEGAWVAIAAPFGWPQQFVAALVAYERGGAWRQPGKLEFRYRASDRFAHDYVLSAAGERLWPLSVASDRVALTARRLAGLREAQFERSGVRFDRAGGDGVVEAYPAAALALWGLRRGDHRAGEQADDDRRAAAAAAREAILAALEDRLGAVSWAAAARQACAEEAAAFEALLCALVARAAALRLTVSPPASELARASAEGWIHLPQPGTLTSLASPDRAAGLAEAQCSRAPNAPTNT